MVARLRQPAGWPCNSVRESARLLGSQRCAASFDIARNLTFWHSECSDFVHAFLNSFQFRWLRGQAHVLAQSVQRLVHANIEPVESGATMAGNLVVSRYRVEDGGR